MKKLVLIDGKYEAVEAPFFNATIDAVTSTATLQPLAGGQAVVMTGLGLATGVLLSAFVFGSKKKKPGSYAWFDSMAGNKNENRLASV